MAGLFKIVPLCHLWKGGDQYLILFSRGWYLAYPLDGFVEI